MEGDGGGKGERERFMYCIISRVFNTVTLPLHPPTSGFFLMSLF